MHENKKQKNFTVFCLKNFHGTVDLGYKTKETKGLAWLDRKFIDEFFKTRFLKHDVENAKTSVNPALIAALKKYKFDQGNKSNYTPIKHCDNKFVVQSRSLYRLRLAPVMLPNQFEIFDATDFVFPVEHKPAMGDPRVAKQSKYIQLRRVKKYYVIKFKFCRYI